MQAPTGEQRHRYQHQMAGSIERGNSGSRAGQLPPLSNPPILKPANFSKPGPTSPEVRRRPVPIQTHRRSSSIGSVGDAIRNVNRWSQSTTSSKGGSPAHRRSGSLSRRLSLGATSTFDFGGKLERAFDHGKKPSVSEVSIKENSRGSSRHGRRPTNPTQMLPPIITLPALNKDQATSPRTGLSASPSTAGLLSAAVRTAAPDYFGHTWDETLSPNTRRANRSEEARNRSPIPTSALFAAENTTRSHSSSGHRQERDRSQSRGHSRNRSHADKGSAGTTGSSRGHKDRSHRGPSQKAMLSKALQKANTAVVLDNARNVEGAIEAYQEACNLLLQVMSRSSGDDDRRKLEAIRNTYTSRIAELEQIFPSYGDDEKDLPARPESQDYGDDTAPLPIDEDDDEDEEDEADEGVIGMATVTRIVNHDSYMPEPHLPHHNNHEIQPSQIPQRRQSLMPPFEQQQQQPKPLNHLADQIIPRSTSRSPVPPKTSHLSPPMDRQSMMVNPLSPRRPLSPAPTAPAPAHPNHPPVAHPEAVEENQAAHQLHSQNLPGSAINTCHRRQVSQESMSWLDTIDESGGSTTSSVHSRTSSFHVRRKHIRAASGATEAEFDAALDAAVEAAYDDGFEPVSQDSRQRFEHELDQSDHDEYDEELMSLRRKVELARERVRETEREAAIHLARDRARDAMSRQEMERGQMDGVNNTFADDSEAEEERMLEEMTRGYVMDDFDFGMQSKSALPRESDSSGYTERTWHTSVDSKTTADRNTMMSTIGEEHSRAPSTIPEIPDAPPPSAPLPAPPGTTSPQQLSRPLGHKLKPSDGQNPKETLRSKRLSGQGQIFKQLKIETASSASSISEAPYTASPALSRPSSRPGTSSGMPLIPNSASSAKEMPPPPVPGMAALQQPRSRQGSESIAPHDLTTPPTPTQNVNLQNGDELPRSGSPGRAPSRGGIRKNFSSSSLKNLKVRNLSVSNIDEDSTGPSPNTPLQTQFATAPKMPAMPTLPTPITTAFAASSKLHMPSGGLYLFDNDIHYPEDMSMSSTLMFEAPVPLEPCPMEFMLRPFWLMRQLYQTLVHPRGGYLSTKLFVPREVWQVKNVKIKALEEKISACDYLTAALGKLARVDTNDADAVLEEMQGFEDSLEQTRLSLIKKLGSEVGVHGSGMFANAPPGTDSEISGTAPKSSSMPGKSSSFSWRRLRSKSSGLALNSYSGASKQQIHQPTEGRETLSMSTLPMTTMSNIRFTKRNVSQARFEGPNANYMGALARLFDAAQILDQIARQVEDPGLRHADKTQVGLELSTRHAAEFFGFYIVRFVLNDVGLLMDKFVKRGAEWVMI